MFITLRKLIFNSNPNLVLCLPFLFPNPSRHCSIFYILLLLFFAPVSSLLPFLTLLCSKLEGRDCFFFIFMAPRVSVQCCKKLRGCRVSQLSYSFFKPSSRTSIPYFPCSFSLCWLLLSWICHFGVQYFMFIYTLSWLSCNCLIYVSLKLCPCPPRLYVPWQQEELSLFISFAVPGCRCLSGRK